MGKKESILFGISLQFSLDINSGFTFVPVKAFWQNCTIKSYGNDSVPLKKKKAKDSARGRKIYFMFS